MMTRHGTVAQHCEANVDDTDDSHFNNGKYEHDDDNGDDDTNWFP